MTARLGKLGYELLKFGLRPSSGGSSAHVAQCSEGECKLGNVIPIGSIYNDNEVVVAGREIDLLDSTPTFLASSLEASALLGASLTERIPWSVQLRDSMNVGMCSSLSRLDDRV